MALHHSAYSPHSQMLVFKAPTEEDATTTNALVTECNSMSVLIPSHA
jgi:hypothetical protein